MIVAARAPNHLGDGVMALPALHALATLGELVVYAPKWGPALFRDVPATVVPRGPLQGDVAVLFPPSLRAALEAVRVPRRIGVAGDARTWLLTDVVAPGAHRRDTYAALAAAAGATVTDPPRYTVRATDPDPAVPDGHVALIPLSGTGATVEWQGYAALAARLDRPVVWYAGPGEGARLARVAGPGTQRVGLPVPAYARALARAAVVVANDSGPAHLARAVGAPTVVVFGSTVPSRTGPAGAVAVEGPSVPCRPCYRKACRFGLECLAVDVDAVLAAIAALP